MTALAREQWPATIGRVLASVAFVLVLWHLAALTVAGSYMLAGPVVVAQYLVENSSLIWRALVVTAQNAAWGFLAGNLAAIGLALIVLMIPQSRMLVASVALVVFCLPLVATGPVLRVLYGPGPGPQITLAALSVYYTTFIPLLVGLRAAPGNWFDMIRLYGRGAWSAFVHVRIMAAMPYLIAGLQVAAPAAFLGAMVGEFTGADRGLGVLTLRALRALNVEATWAIALVAASVSMVAYWAIGWLADRITPSRPEILLATTPAPVRGPMAQRALRALVLGLATTVIVVALWWLVMEAFSLNRFFAKRPDDIWHYLVTAPNATAHRAALWTASTATLVQVVPGYLAGLFLGAGLALLLALLPILAGGVLPVAIALRSVPIVTTAPLIVLALGRGAVGTITIVAVMTFFPALVACIQGLRQAPGQVLDLMRLYATNPLAQLWHAQIPAMLPAFFAAARLSVPAAILAVTVAEWLATGRGLGALMAMTASTSDYNLLWSAIVVVAVGAAFGYGLVGLIERLVLARVAPEQLRR
ncbi:MAG: ABC transporter permease subunit [Rhodobacteraceae bacterium]|nr:MAG: ABC transporter permease subunit [Paracoccaceae bacterium]